MGTISMFWVQNKVGLESLDLYCHKILTKHLIYMSFVLLTFSLYISKKEAFNTNCVLA